MGQYPASLQRGASASRAAADPAHTALGEAVETAA